MLRLYFEEIDDVLEVASDVWKRACNLMEANEAVREACDDEEDWFAWIMLAVPDEATALDYVEIAEDLEEYEHAMDLATRLIYGEEE